MKVRNPKLLITIVLSLFLIVSCQKSLSDQNIKYLGSWGSDKHSIEIWKNGRAVYQKKNQNVREGTVKIENNKIKFSGGISKTFTIDSDPYSDGNGNIIMILNGDTFYKH
jgi:hypothetical protein